MLQDIFSPSQSQQKQLKPNLPQYMFELQHCQLLCISTQSLAELGLVQSIFPTRGAMQDLSSLSFLK